MHSRAATSNSQLRAIPVPAIINPWFSRRWIEDEGFWAGFPEWNELGQDGGLDPLGMQRPSKRSINPCWPASAPSRFASGTIRSSSGCLKFMRGSRETPIPLPSGCSSDAARPSLPLLLRAARPNWVSPGLIGRKSNWEMFRTIRRRSSTSQSGPIRKRMWASAILAEAMNEDLILIEALPARLGDRIASQSRHHALDDLLQQPPPALRPWRHPGSRVLSASNPRNPTRSAGAKSSLLPRNLSKR